ncbi:hypothetical protein FA15DRAFT_759037 [Coprinopsis marcescibilis]|uniref:Uncharacterized protein n=1 Tax=Coprinopsis marcescibilis TaxID=230819 RepID=A0A5C3KLU8_COPMA|nr:hypothetical protein FA15DRAFT_759037 [Coprinopsis marcescibilis]
MAAFFDDFSKGAYIDKGVQVELCVEAKIGHGDVKSLGNETCSCFCHRNGKFLDAAAPEPVQSASGTARPTGLGHRLPRPQRQSNRVVSLPEMPESESDMIFYQPRVVSLPGFLPAFDDSYSSDECPLGADIPSTPQSPPFQDQNDWSFWANSPPKPIPALHGPLSLPYARCPSGAEGTIIEGDHASNTIWGLDQQYSLRLSTPEPEVFAVPEPRFLYSKQAHMYTGRATGIGNTRKPNTVERSSSDTYLQGADNLGRQSQPLASAHIRKPPYDQFRGPVADIELPGAPGDVNFLSSQLAGLGFGADMKLNHLMQEHLHIFGRPPLKPYQSYGHNLTQGDYLGLNQFQPLRTRDESLLSPLTTSSQWTPLFPNTPGTPFTPGLDNAGFSKVASLGLHQFPGADENSPLGFQSDRFVEVQRNFMRHGKPIAGSSSPVPGLSHRTGTSFEDYFSPFGKNVVSTENLATSRQTFHRHSFSEHEPKSVPLTRLVQRKLASVTEEDGGALDRAVGSMPLDSLPTTRRTPSTRSSQGPGSLPAFQSFPRAPPTTGNHVGARAQSTRTVTGTSNSPSKPAARPVRSEVNHKLAKKPSTPMTQKKWRPKKET